MLYIIKKIPCFKYIYTIDGILNIYNSNINTIINIFYLGLFYIFIVPEKYYFLKNYKNNIFNTNLFFKNVMIGSIIYQIILHINLKNKLL